MNTLWNDNPASLVNDTVDRLALGRLVEPTRTWRSSLQIAHDTAEARRRRWTARLR